MGHMNDHWVEGVAFCVNMTTEIPVWFHAKICIKSNKPCKA